MKFAIVLLAFASVAYGGNVYGGGYGYAAPAIAYGGYGGYGGVVNTGSSVQSRQQDNHGNYAFSYDENSAHGGTFRNEKGSHGVQVGSYGLRDADGRVRIVEYVADAGGFRAKVKSNEPGVGPNAPAATVWNGHVAPIPAPEIVAAPSYGYSSYGGNYGGNYGGYGYGGY